MSILKFQNDAQPQVQPDPNLDFERLISCATENSTRYQQAAPFPHIVFQDFLPAGWLKKVNAEFVSKEALQLESTKTVHSKGSNTAYSQWGPNTQKLMSLFCSADFLEFLEKLTGIEGLIPDPYFEGGGLHETQDGGFLKIHADYNFSSRTKLDRRLNMLIYLNEDWEDSYGGHLELWDPKMEKCQTQVRPDFNTCAIFSTTDNSFHGHPDPLTSKGRPRRSLALYYFSNGRPEEEVSDRHVTVYKVRPNEVFKSLSEQASSEVPMNGGFLKGDWLYRIKGKNRWVSYSFDETHATKIVADPNAGLIKSTPVPYRYDNGALLFESEHIAPRVAKVARYTPGIRSEMNWSFSDGRKSIQLVRLREDQLEKRILAASLGSPES